MMKGSYICTHCGKSLASSQSLWNHKQRCNCNAERVAKIYSPYSSNDEIPTFEGSDFLAGKPRSKETLDRLEGFVSRPPPPQIVEVPKTNDIQRTRVMNMHAAVGGDPRLKKFKSVNDHHYRSLHDSDSNEKRMIEKSLPRLDVVQFSDSNDSDDSSEDDGTIDVSDLPPPDKVKFLPVRISGLRARFEVVLKKIAVNRKSGTCEKTTDRNEAVFLLDELKRQGGISQRRYVEYNNFLAESLPLGFRVSDQEEQETAMETDEEDEIKKQITDTADYLIEHDKKALLEITNEIEREDAIMETVTTLEELIKIYLEREFLKRESVAENIHELVERLSANKNVQKSTLLRIKMLVNDIAANRARVKEIVNRFNQAGDVKATRLFLFENLKKEELISEQQYLKLVDEIDAMDMKKLTNIIRETKIGRGMNFLPRKTDVLIDTLQQWLQELVENGGTALKNHISSLLNELRQRKKISEERYSQLKQQHNIE